VRRHEAGRADDRIGRDELVAERSAERKARQTCQAVELSDRIGRDVARGRDTGDDVEGPVLVRVQHEREALSVVPHRQISAEDAGKPQGGRPLVTIAVSVAADAEGLQPDVQHVGRGIVEHP
jgi:hypothetical protein